MSLPATPGTSPAFDAPAGAPEFGRFRPRLLLAAVLLLYACVQFFAIAVTPLQRVALPDNMPQGRPQTVLVGLGPDEREHFLYILSLADGGALPMPDPAHRTSPRQYVTYQAQHPPLFYALAALVYEASSGLPPAAVWYLLRALCALCGAAVIVLAAEAARLSFPERPFFALAAAPCVAFLPMFGYMTANLSNEPLGMVFGAAAWLQLVRLARGRTPYTVRAGALLGLTLGLAALTRLTALLWLPAAALVLWHCVRRIPPPRRAAQALGPLLVGAACFLALLAPWLLHNEATFGTALVRSYHRPLLGSSTLAQFVSGSYFTPYLMLTALWDSSTAWCPFWLVQFVLPGGPNAAPLWQMPFLLLNVSLLLALAWNGWRSRRAGAAPPGGGQGGQKGGQDAAGRLLLWAAFCAVAFCVLVLFQQCVFVDWQVMDYAGRYLAAATPASALLLLAACAGLFRPSQRAARVAAALLAAVLLASDLCTIGLVHQFYRTQPRPPSVQRL